jgi:hypothetical protein
MFFTALRPAPQIIMTLNAALRRDNSYFFVTAQTQLLLSATVLEQGNVRDAVTHGAVLFEAG